MRTVVGSEIVRIGITYALDKLEGDGNTRCVERRQEQ
jgi:hypothetical protein